MSLGSLRGALFADPLIVLATIFFGSVSLIVSFFDDSGRKQIAVARAWAKVLLLVSGVRVRVHGIEKIDPRGSYVIASNHLSYMDTPAILANIPVQFRFLAKEGLFRIPLLGDHLRRAGHIPVPRGNPRAAVKTMTEAGRMVRERGISLLIFPEGGRSSGELQEFKEGAAFIAIKAGVPVVPVALSGSNRALPRDSLLVRPASVTMRIGDPVDTSKLTVHDRARLTSELYAIVANLLAENERTATAAKSV